MTGCVRIVHAVDTEGPLFESVEATFDRLKEVFGIDNILPTQANLRRIQNGEVDFGARTILIREALSSHRVNTLGSWHEITRMLEKITSKEYREHFPDSDGNGWVFNWFCLDHVGFNVNPRKRDIGFHNIHDYYEGLVKSQTWAKDSIQWHFHPVSTYKEAHRCATHYLRTDEIYQILSRRIIERSFFPSCYRAGFQAERPDSHWFLEQFIPFDISNMATKDTTDIDNAIDFKNGRSGNWRKAPSDWSVYHPSHDDYQVRGSCRRLIGRALNLRNRIGNMTQDEMDVAFNQAQKGREVLLGLCSHDWRDMDVELKHAQDMLAISKERFPDVKFIYSQAVDAFRFHVKKEVRNLKKLKLSIVFHPEEEGKDVPFVEIRTVNGKVFGPQPYLAIQTKSNIFLHDNLDFSTEEGVWYYAFHEDTLPLTDVKMIGIAANDFLGNTEIVKFNPELIEW
jgi:hypothetical protein